MSGIMPDPHESMLYCLTRINDAMVARNYRGAYTYTYHLLALIYFSCVKAERESGPPIIRLPGSDRL